MGNLPIHWILARTYCQATEEEARVVSALEASVSGGSGLRHAFDGQYGNAIVILERRLESSAEIRATWERWATAGLLGALQDQVDARVDDDAVIHFRIDKQKAFQGTLALGREGDTIDIQVKVKAYPARPEEIRRVARRLVAGGL